MISASSSVSSYKCPKINVCSEGFIAGSGVEYVAAMTSSNDVFTV